MHDIWQQQIKWWNLWQQSKRMQQRADLGPTKNYINKIKSIYESNYKQAIQG